MFIIWAAFHSCGFLLLNIEHLDCLCWQVNSVGNVLSVCHILI